MKNVSLVFIVNFGNQLISHSFFHLPSAAVRQHFCVKCTPVLLGIADNQSNYVSELYEFFCSLLAVMHPVKKHLSTYAAE